MASIQIYVEQVDKYSFLVKETLHEVPAVSTASVKFLNPYTAEEVTIDVAARWAEIIDNGTIINISEFPDGKMGDYDYFPDGVYNVTLEANDGAAYESKTTVGFSKIIQDVVAQQAIQSDWKTELNCSCEKYSTTFRKFNYLKNLEFAANNCLWDEYQEILEALYKLTGTTYEYESN